ncbi:hypothetical protein H1V43_36635 [Streptomyces sp. PSKA54]|uniref:Uncharacterized protein n=1 Tax=Streptomyces himalayensis subsp. aureolus TaxID=2758039 RepID=A0A7W2HK27_9ACTN|nr:hypothetical protein [Streptomyces himalayensis subsp. aureolus]
MLEVPPVIVHPPLHGGGRRVTVQGKDLGVAHSDRQLLEFLRQAGLPEAEDLIDDPEWVKWDGRPAHIYGGG